MDLKKHIPFVGSNKTSSNSEDGMEAAEEEMEEKLENASAGEEVVLTKDATTLVPDEMQVYRDYIVSDGTYFRTFVVDDWPPRLQQDLFAGIIKSATLNFDFSLHLEPYDDQDAVNKIESLARKMEDKRSGDFSRFISNKESMVTTEQTLTAMKQHITQGEKLFDVTFYITLKSDSKDQLEEHTDELRNKLEREARLGLNHCRYQQKAALVSNSPVSINRLAEKNDSFKQLMLSSAVAKTFPFMEDTFMEKDGVLYGINENSMTPTFVDIFARSNGYNQLTTGMIGSGKSFSTSQVLLEMERAYTDFQQFIVDPMGGFQGVNNALGGQRIIISGSESINPMEIKETPEHVIEKAQGKLDPWAMKKQELRWFFTEFFYDPENEEGISSHEKAMLDQAITQTYNRFGITQDINTHGKESPTILDLIGTLEMMAEDAADFSNTDLEQEADKRRETVISLLLRMEPFKENGEYHNLAQPTEIDITKNDVIYLDLQQIPENSDNLGIMMQLLFMKIYQNAKSTSDKVAITIDEAHKILGDENITGGLEELFRHSRHFDVSINLISQTPEEFYINQTAETIAKQCTIKRFHRVDSLNNDLVENKLELNEREVNFVENAEMGEGDKDYSEALLVIQDEDRSIPLRIEATKDEQMVIGYDPTESVREYTTQSQQRLKMALDTYNQNDNPILVNEDDEMVQEVKSQIIQKRRSRKRMIAEEDPSLLTEAERKSLEQDGDIDVIESDETQDQTETTEINQSANGSTVAGVQNNTSTANSDREPTGRDKIKRQLEGPSSVRELDDRHIERIATQYGLKEDSDSRKELEQKIIEDFFSESEIRSQEDESPTGDQGTNTNSNEDRLGDLLEDPPNESTTNESPDASKENESPNKDTPSDTETPSTEQTDDGQDIDQIKQQVGEIVDNIDVELDEEGDPVADQNTETPTTDTMQTPDRNSDSEETPTDGIWSDSDNPPAKESSDD